MKKKVKVLTIIAVMLFSLQAGIIANAEKQITNSKVQTTVGGGIV